MSNRLDLTVPIILSKGDPSRMRTHRILDASFVPYQVLVHDESSVDGCLEAGIDRERVVWTDGSRPKSCVDDRNWLLEQVPMGYWMIGLDDNLEQFTQVEPDLYRRADLYELDVYDGTNWRPRFRHPMSGARLMEAFEELTDKCESMGTVYGGFASCENPYFRSSRWSFSKFVKTKAYVIKRVPGMTFKTNTAHDSYMSAWAVAHYGSDVVNNWIYPKYPPYEGGGIGSREQRLPLLDRDCQVSIDEFPGLVGRAKGANSALKFLRSGAAIDKWREQNGYPK